MTNPEVDAVQLAKVDGLTVIADGAVQNESVMHTDGWGLLELKEPKLSSGSAWAQHRQKWLFPLLDRFYHCGSFASHGDFEWDKASGFRIPSTLVSRCFSCHPHNLQSCG